MMRILKRIFLILFSVGLTSSASSAGSLPHTAIGHNAPEYFTAGTRLVLDALLDDPQGIREARCYFRTDADPVYLYVSMNRLADNRYRCSLPEFGAGPYTLEYLFLIVNGSRQVIRSAPYFAAEAGNGELQEEQAAAGLPDVLQVRSELGAVNREDTAIADERIVLAPTADSRQLYGLRAGIYEEEAVPASLNVMAGYFGGFVLDRRDKTIRPVKGLAPNLGSSSSGSDGAPVPVPNSADTTADSLVVEETVPTVLTETVDPPQIAGDDWTGYFTRTDSDVKEDLTAVVTLSGNNVTITTTLTDLGHFLAGTINENGDMLLYDTYDGEDWTTHYGPATSTEINIYDYIWPPALGEPEPPLNVIILYRPPLPPANLQASDGLYPDDIIVTWDLSDGATLYDVYSCSTDLTDSCKFLSEVDTTEYVDTRGLVGRIYFRVQACNTHGCGQFSDYDTGYNKHVVIPQILHLLLRSG